MKKAVSVCLIIAAALFSFPLLLRIVPFKALTEFEEQEYSTRIYDREGLLIQVVPIENGDRREYTPIKNIPKAVQKAFIKQEDKRFYFHHGVDWVAVGSAFIQNKKAGKTVRGGSTITMQLAKAINKSNEITLKRKLKDAFYAYRLEAKLSKKKILELYLNHIYFGYASQGITSAARTYFGKELSELTPGQIEVLSVIPRNPTFYNPINHTNRFKAFSDEAYEAAAEISAPHEYEINMPHFVNYLKTVYKPMPYEIHTSVDLEIYRYAQGYLMEAMEQAENSRISNGSLLLLNNSDGSVLAWIGNGDFFDDANGGQIDGVLVRNQPGSSMKPFLYALGIETGISEPSKIIADVPSEFGSDKLYIPENFNNRFNGPVRTRIALASSLNIPAVTTLNEIGVDKYLEKLYELGFESLRFDGKNADLGLALGAGEVKLYELVPAFSCFVRDGAFIPVSVTLDEAQKNSSSLTHPYSPDTARIICSILSDKTARALGFGYTQTFQTDYPSIFKTGTSNQYQNIIALGATKNYTIGVWMGNFAGQTVMGKTGSSLPAWVAKCVLDKLEGGHYNAELEFQEPEHWHNQKICPLSGMAAGPDCPSSVFEYIKDSTTKDECNWHKKINDELKTIYPPEYQQWARKNVSFHGIIDYSSAPLTIITPKDNSLFYYSRQNLDQQAISIEVTGGAHDELSIVYDGKKIGSVTRPFIFTLPVERGEHCCTVTCGIEERTVHFKVN